MVDIFTTIILLAISVFIIYKSSDWLIRYAVTLAKMLGVSTFVIGFILVAISTSLPEIMVSIFATLEGEANLAVADVLGSNLFNLTVVIGGAILVAGTIHVKRKETPSLIEYLFITSVITIIFFSQSYLNVIHGAILIVLGIYMMGKLYKGGRVSAEVFEDSEILILPKKKKKYKNAVFKFFQKQRLSMVILKFSISVALLLASSRMLVDSSINLATLLGVSTIFIGATIVAAGTSIPELSVTITAVKKKQYALAMGDIVGSAVTNITIVLGIIALISTTTLNVVPLAGMVPFIILSTMLVWYYFSEKGKITRNEAIILLLIYVVFILEQLGIVAIFG
ncbi:MAG: sodium:calcium antiporter [Nanoarchaeota archaeon]|nr:sodium:calcium antiporter [Nanoarchaeota archaeon]MBU1135708.1 sodium:calcium antiporter [Nanoarchaeota archaeon]MBU2520500.1 sodium:calcium antiporter [Nanoarchaeota archaeon]